MCYHSEIKPQTYTGNMCRGREQSFRPNVTVRSRSVYGSQSKIAAVTAGKSRANFVSGRCGKQLPVTCCLHLAALFQLFLEHSRCFLIFYQALFNGES